MVFLSRPDPIRAVHTVLVTGGAGYVGSALVRGLLSDGLRVRVLDTLAHGDAGIRALYTNPDFELLRGDVRQTETVVRATRGADAVIHLAGLVGERACRADPDAAIELNVAAASLVTEVCRGMDVMRLVLPSTLDVYGEQPREVDESAPPDPRTLFSATKLDAEKRALSARDASFHPVVFRLGEVFGADVHASFETGMNRTIAAAWRRGRLDRRPSSRPIYRTHVSDVCAAMRQALVCRPEVISGETFNVGSEGARCSSAAINRWLAEAAPQLGSCGAGVETRAERPGPEICFGKLRTRLGVVCRASPARGVAELVQRLEREGASSVRPAPRPPLSHAGLAGSRFLR